MMNPCSEEEYFHKLDNMVIGSTHYLGQIFKKRWKVESGEEWKEEENCIQNFVGQHCEHILKKAMPVQKKILLESCSSHNWDISLMSLVLLNFGDGIKYKVHNQAVRQLTILRNELAHHKSKTFTQKEYYKRVKMFKESLQALEVTEFEINKLIEQCSVSSSSEVDKRVNVLLENAEKLMKMQEFESALKHYSEALTIPGLLPVNLGEVYEKRAACYLSIKDETVLNAKHTDQAFLDVEQALKLNESSWNAHYLKAQCHKKKNNLPEAIRYYEKALDKSPMQKQIRQDLDSCKLLNDAHTFNTKLNLDFLPISLYDQVRQVESETGWNLPIQELIKDQRKYPSFIGDQYYHGWEVPQDYKKAVKYYTIAYRQGDAEGCLKLGGAYLRGHGVEQDVGKGFEMIKRCAGMNVKQLTRFDLTPLGFNEFVATAEHNMGKFYEDGLHVEKDLSQAAYWYGRSMKHGFGEAARNLGRLFNDFVPKSEKMAEMCWKQGINFKNSKSAECLVDYYRSQMEPEMAWIMLNIAREMGSSQYLEMSDEEFNRDLPLTILERSTMEKCVSRFEKQQNLGLKGMTMRQRFLRMEDHVDPTNSLIRTNKNSGGKIQQTNLQDMLNLRLKAISGSETASQLVETVETIIKLNELLEIKNDFPKAYKLKVVNLYYDFMSLDNHLVNFMTNVDKFKTIVAELFIQTCEQFGEDEMKICLCYVSHNLRQSLEEHDDLYTLGILKEGLRQYPNNYVYYRILIDCLKFRCLNKNALQYINEALQKFPEKVDLFYENADIVLRIKDRKSCEVITAFKTFLSKAPRDHRFVPEAYYFISHAHMEDYLNHEQDSNPNYKKSKKLKLIRKNLKCAKDAEKDQLPCYLPYGVSDTQLIVTRFLAKLQKDIPEGSSNDDTVVEAIHELPDVLELKVYIQSPVRRGLILQHRERLREVYESIKKPVKLNKEIFPVKFQQNRAKKISQLNSITLQEMNPIKEKIYQNRILDLTIIEDPNTFHAATEIIAEDENGDTTRLYIDNTQNKYEIHRFQVGFRFSVINPYMWYFETTGINGVRINEPKCIICLEKVKDMCRFCGEENATHKCSNCKWLYCSTECQMLDRKLFDHEKICLLISEGNLTASKIKGQLKQKSMSLMNLRYAYVKL